ncbi:hypothetical protein BKA62DRAFT_833949 [Auriculariales sp. MPI-PUGE-AT-0066]|nr:hypothetical protein BKA62DRAFT_833949 [Auriculariales sp. MPI-PUGE-AT-0066]
MPKIDNAADLPASGPESASPGVTSLDCSTSPSRNSALNLGAPLGAPNSETMAASVHASKNERANGAGGNSNTTRRETVPDAARPFEPALTRELKKVELPLHQENPSSLMRLTSARYPHLPRFPDVEDTLEKRYPLSDPTKYTEHEKRYPPDRYGEELGRNARLFRIYHDRVTEKDEDLVQGWHETLNVLLVFAGLFSAVLTAFLIESSRQLQPDYTETTAVAVLAVLAQLQGTNSSTSATVHHHFAPTTDARWINGLWFTSLMLALIVSLLAILVKQWLVQYTSLMRSSAGDAKSWACRHFALRDGLSTWGIEPFISGLAVLLHMALFLFLWDSRPSFVG